MSSNAPVQECKKTSRAIAMGDRTNFDLHRITNDAGMNLSFFRNGGTHQISTEDLQLNQVEGHPLQGGFDRAYVRFHRPEGIQAVPVHGVHVPCAFYKNGAVWTHQDELFTASVRWVLTAHEPLLYRVCSIENTGVEPMEVDWLVGQDIGLASPGALTSNEAYVSQYLDHKILNHPRAGRVVLNRNNLHHEHPVLIHACLQGAGSASTDATQFFGVDHTVTHLPAALKKEQLADRVKQYESAYVALQSQRIVIQPGDRQEVVFTMHLIPDHPDVSSEADLRRIDEIQDSPIPRLDGAPEAGGGSAFFASVPILSASPLTQQEGREFYPQPWRHEESAPDGALYSFFTAEDTHVVLPSKEAAMERTHGHILKSGLTQQLDPNVISVSCYGHGAFGSQFAVGNTNFGRYTTLVRNSLGLDRSSGLRMFIQMNGRWEQLGFPSLFAVSRRACRWIYILRDLQVEVVAEIHNGYLSYRVNGLNGTLPSMRMTFEVCGDMNDFDAAPGVEWDADQCRLIARLAETSLMREQNPNSCMMLEVNAADGFEIGGAERLEGALEPYVVLDVSPTSQFSFRMTGHAEGPDKAQARFAAPEEGSWAALTSHFSLSSNNAAGGVLEDTVRWYAHNAMIHYEAPRGIEQYGGAAWGTRDVCQGPLEFFLSVGKDSAVRDILCRVFTHQFTDGTWPQWFMFEGFSQIKQHESHGDIVFWPIKALCEYVEQTGDLTILDEELPYADPATLNLTETRSSLREHLERAYQFIVNSVVEGTCLPSYGEGDWNDALQPANREMKTRMVSGWTSGLAYQSLSMLVEVWRHVGMEGAADTVRQFVDQLAEDFRTHVLRNGVAAGFVFFGDDGVQPLLHPEDEQTGIHYRLLSVNRSILSGLFTQEEAAFHLTLVDEHLKYPDGVRLMDRPAEYTGGQSVFFQRAETAAHFGREIGLQYVHAHLRYCEVLARMGRAEELVKGLLTVSPVAIQQTVPNAGLRQSNLYFSSSDADVNDRYEATARMDDLKQGRIKALGGWRLYSSGPGIYTGLVIHSLFGIRRSYGHLVLDPVLPASMDGSVLRLDWQGKTVRWVFHVKDNAYSPNRVAVNGRDINPLNYKTCRYRSGGAVLPIATFEGSLSEAENRVEIWL